MQSAVGEQHAGARPIIMRAAAGQTSELGNQSTSGGSEERGGQNPLSAPLARPKLRIGARSLRYRASPGGENARRDRDRAGVQSVRVAKGDAADIKRALDLLRLSGLRKKKERGQRSSRYCGE